MPTTRPWDPITRRGNQIESESVVRAQPKSRPRGGFSRRVPLTVVVEAFWPEGPAGWTVAIIRQPPHETAAPQARYVPSTLILALLRKGTDGWEWFRLGDAPVRNGTAKS